MIRDTFLQLSWLPCFMVVLMSACLSTDPSGEPPRAYPTQTLSPCTARANFGDPDDSPYVLPFPVGKSYWVSQSYCDPQGSHQNQLAYDFQIPVGVDITAARDGRVVEIREDTPDICDWEYYGLHNYIMIEHEDHSTAFYAHLKQYSVMVEIGDWVDQGQLIAKSGNSGFTGYRPHLHFGVYRSYPPVEGDDIAVNFSNGRGPLDERGGLIQWRYYEALPYP